MHATDTSRQAIAGMSLPHRKLLLDEVATAIAQLLHAGHADVSMREIQRHMEMHMGRRVDVSSISGRVNELEAAQRVFRDRMRTRPCSVTGKGVHPLTMVPEQRRMFA